jgi:hypothetical protein
LAGKVDDHSGATSQGRLGPDVEVVYGLNNQSAGEATSKIQEKMKEN